MTTNTILIASITIALLLLAFSLWVNYKAKQRPKLLDEKGNEVKVNKEVKAALVYEYNLIQAKKSKFSAAKRKKIVELTEHLVKTGKINRSLINPAK